MARAAPEQIVTRYTQLKQETDLHRPFWAQVAPYCAPSRGRLFADVVTGDAQTRGVYDATATMSAQLAANFIAASAINPTQRWGGLAPASPEEASPLEREGCEAASRLIETDFSHSLFYGEAVECILDWLVFGTGCLITDEAPESPITPRAGWRGSYYECIPIGRYAIAEGPDGLVHTLMYEKNMPAHVLADRFGLAVLPDSIKKAVTTRPDQLFPVLRAIYPRSHAERATSTGATAMPWASCWIELSTKTLLQEGGYDVFPAVVPRFYRTPGEVFGRGLAQVAWSDIYALNAAKRLALQDMALRLMPPLFYAHDSVVMGTIKLTPGGATPIMTRGQSIRDVVHPYESGSRPDLTVIREEELRRSIRQVFYIDHILALMQVNKSEMTAFEYAKKIDLLFRLIGPVYGRLRREFLEQLWLIKFAQMARAGAFDAVLPGVTDAKKFRVVFDNPLERAQRSSDLDAVLLAMQDFMQMAPVMPRLFDWIDEDRLAQYILTVRGVPAVIAREERDVLRRREQRSVQEQQAAELAQMQQVSEAAKNVAPMLRAIRPAF